MEDAGTITTAVKAAFAAVNFLVWTGLFLFMLRLHRKVRGLEAAQDTRTETRTSTRVETS